MLYIQRGDGHEATSSFEKLITRGRRVILRALLMHIHSYSLL